jgi:hypothetical protein
MINQVFWYTGLAVWFWVAFLCLLAIPVGLHHLSVRKRARLGVTL